MTQAFGGTRGILEDFEASLFLENVGAQGKLPDSMHGGRIHTPICCSRFRLSTINAIYCGLGKLSNVPLDEAFGENARVIGRSFQLRTLCFWWAYHCFWWMDLPKALRHLPS
ncbi:hypothetical protein OPQ81_008905 [Rhizoctonia solani]|nr:hypothetical protein OPQ81_008905 [Rhizoctonia solani]